MADQKYPPLPEGFVLEQPGNTGPAGMPPLPPGFELMPSAGPSPAGHPSFEEGQALLNAEEQQQRMQGASGTIGATLTGLADGVPIAGPALLGAGQRGAAIASTVMNGGTYDENLKQAQDITQQAQDAHPWMTTGAKLTSGVASLAPVASTALGARALGITGETLGGRTVAGMLSGGAIGGSDAAARSGGDLTETGKGLALGTLFGGIAPAAGAAIGAGTRKILDWVRSPGKGVERNLATSLAADALDDAAARARLTELGPEGMIADLGDNLRGDLSAVTTMPGRGQTVGRSALSTRDAGAGQRITADANASLGNAGDIIADRAAYVQQRADAAQPLYDRAYAVPLQKTEAMDNVLKTPAGQKAFRSAQRTAQNEGLPIDPAKLDVRGLDLVKREIDDQISVAQRAGKKNEARVLTTMKNKLIEGAPGEYKEALKAFSGPSGMIDALDNGRSVFQRSVHPGEVAAEIKALSGADRDAYLQGARSALDEVMMNARNDGGAARAMFEKGANKAKLYSLLGNDEAKRFITALDRETTFAGTSYAATGNSVTAGRQAAQQRWGSQQGGEGPLRAALNMNFGDAVAALGGKLNQVQNEAAMAAQRGRAADILTARGPAAADQLQSLSWLRRLQAQNAAIGGGAGTATQVLGLSASPGFLQSLREPR
ncbi:hypothetical protein [Agrobacterium tumefaciens]|uniref:hypothetical protein n=1 Tax=Agrobacterium tumefaciens TaxID=358 RepID=UPI001574CD5D|nr:hypothetical protein [Agrobacterium tumefaciens]